MVVGFILSMYYQTISHYIYHFHVHPNITISYSHHAIIYVIPVVFDCVIVAVYQTQAERKRELNKLKKQQSYSQMVG